MTSHLTYSYRVYHTTDMGQATNYWMQFTLPSRGSKYMYSRELGFTLHIFKVCSW